MIFNLEVHLTLDSDKLGYEVIIIDIGHNIPYGVLKGRFAYERSNFLAELVVVVGAYIVELLD